MPVLFKADELYDYVQKYIPQCRVLASEYCERVKIQAKVKSALNS